MNKPNILNEIKRRIEQSEAGSMFVSADFTDIAENAKIGVSLSRLESENVIRRIIRGVYEKPEFNTFLDEYVAPSPDKVAHAIARSFGWTIVPCGDTALNILGLSTQVPVVWIYVSDGTYKEYSFDNTTIKFKRTTNKEISKLCYKTALVIQAFKALGKNNIDETILSKVAKSLSAQEKKQMLTEARTATSWIYELIKQLSGSKSQ